MVRGKDVGGDSLIGGMMTLVVATGSLSAFSIRCRRFILNKIQETRDYSFLGIGYSTLEVNGLQREVLSSPTSPHSSTVCALQGNRFARLDNSGLDVTLVIQHKKIR